MVKLLRLRDAVKKAIAKPARAIVGLFPIAVELAGLGLVSTGAGMIYRPAAFLVSGTAVIVAVEHWGRAMARREAKP